MRIPPTAVKERDAQIHCIINTLRHWCNKMGATCPNLRALKEFPIELCEYSPGEYITMDLFELNRKYFIRITDKISGLMVGKKQKNKSAEEMVRCLEHLFLMVGPPSKIVKENSTNFTNQKFKKLMEKYDISHAKSAPITIKVMGLLKKVQIL